MMTVREKSHDFDGAQSVAEIQFQVLFPPRSGEIFLPLIHNIPRAWDTSSKSVQKKAPEDASCTR